LGGGIGDAAAVAAEKTEAGGSVAQDVIEAKLRGADDFVALDEEAGKGIVERIGRKAVGGDVDGREFVGLGWIGLGSGGRPLGWRRGDRGKGGERGDGGEEDAERAGWNHGWRKFGDRSERGCPEAARTRRRNHTERNSGRGKREVLRQQPHHFSLAVVGLKPMRTDAKIG
jgi:hypothetical protein